MRNKVRPIDIRVVLSCGVGLMAFRYLWVGPVFYGARDIMMVAVCDRAEAPKSHLQVIS